MSTSTSSSSNNNKPIKNPAWLGWDATSIHLVRDVLPSAILVTISLAQLIPAYYHLFVEIDKKVRFNGILGKFETSSGVDIYQLWQGLRLLGGIIGLLMTFNYHIFTNPKTLPGKYRRQINKVQARLMSSGQLEPADKSELIRPHPLVWKMVLVLSYLYLGLLSLLIMLPKSQARQLLGLVDPNLGIQIEYLDYADSCELTVNNIWSKTDIFVLAHFVGWAAKAMFLRDLWIMTVISFCWEIIEYALVYQLPNFAECWWDHWILDFALCNFLGGLCGLWLCQWYGAQKYDWRGLYQEPNVSMESKQMTPNWWFDFSSFALPPSTLSRYGLCVLFIIISELVEVNAFYLKYLLWVPPEHDWNKYRLVIIFLMAIPATNQMYHYWSNSTPNSRLGTQTQVFLLIVLMECLLTIVYAMDELFVIPVPHWVQLLTLVTTTFLGVYPVSYFFNNTTASID